jgi:lysyl-tRNA synthetase class 2
MIKLITQKFSSSPIAKEIIDAMIRIQTMTLENCLRNTIKVVHWRFFSSSLNPNLLRALIASVVDSPDSFLDEVICFAYTSQYSTIFVLSINFSMKFKVSSQIFKSYPGYIDGILVVKNIDNSGLSADITELLRGVEKKVREIEGIESVNDYPKIAAWREAHRKFGSSPKKYPPSVQSIFRRVYKGGELPSINKLVDIYNNISLKYVLPAGGEDLDKCSGDIVLGYADGNEKFIELGATENSSPEAGEVVYKDDAGVICRKFNWREADRTKLEESTKNAVLVFECIEPMTKAELEDALNETKDLIEKYCGGKSEIFLLTEENPEVEIS